MNTTIRISTAERLGRSFGRGWRAYARGERRVSNWLISKGVPVAGATALLWVIQLVLLGVLLYAAFWLALLVIFAIVAAWCFRSADWDDEQDTEWRVGPSGFGLYRGDIRIDIGDPNEDE